MNERLSVGKMVFRVKQNFYLFVLLIVICTVFKTKLGRSLSDRRCGAIQRHFGALKPPELQVGLSAYNQGISFIVSLQSYLLHF